MSQLQVRMGGLAALVSALVGPPASAQSPKWHHLQGGMINEVAFYDEDHGCTVEDGGRIRWTEDGGDTWAYADTPDGVRAELFGVHWLTSDVVFACGEGGIVLKSPDKGQNWTDLNASHRVTDLLDDASYDCGEHPAKLYDIFMTDALNGFAVGEKGTIVFTTSGWVSGWSRPADENLPGDFSCGGAAFDLYDVHFFYDAGAGTHWQKGIAASEYGLCLVTTNGGTNWNLSFPLEGNEQCPGPTAANLEFWGLAFSDPLESSSDWWVAGGRATNNGYIFVSSDQGASWTPSHSFGFLDPDDPFGALLVCGVPTLYDIDVVNPATPSFLTAGYAQRVLRFTASGAQKNFDPCADPCAAITPTAASDVWVEKEAEAGAIAPFGDPPLFGLGRSSDTSACLVGQFGRILTYAAGSSPEFTDRATVVHVRLMDGAFVDEDEGFVVGQGWTLWMTQDGGEDWVDAWTWDVDEGNWANAIDLADSGDRGVMVGTGGFIAFGAKTAGTWTWTRLEPPDDIPANLPDLNAVCFVPGSSTVAYAVGNVGRVLKTEDGGETWENLRSAGMDSLYGVSFIDEDTGFLAGAGGKVYRTTTAGVAPWTEVGLSGSPAPTFAIQDVTAWADATSGGDGTAAILVGDGGNVYVKGATDGTFQKVTDSVVSSVRGALFDVEVLSNGTTVRICGENGAVLFRDSGTWSAPKSEVSRLLRKMEFQSGSHGFGVGSDFVIAEYRVP